MDATLEKYDSSLEYAQNCDSQDTLRAFRERFHFPEITNGNEPLYFAGNSLGLQPNTARAYVEQELEDWARLAVDAHIHAKHPWLPYHEFLTGTDG
jgi:kynureninase